MPNRCFPGGSNKRWPGCPVYVEVPVEPVDRTFGNRLDLLVGNMEGWVLVDHKSNPAVAAKTTDLVTGRPTAASTARALLACAAGKPVLQKWLICHFAGRAVRRLSLTALTAMRFYLKSLFQSPHGLETASCGGPSLMGGGLDFLYSWPAGSGDRESLIDPRPDGYVSSSSVEQCQTCSGSHGV